MAAKETISQQPLPLSRALLLASFGAFGLTLAGAAFGEQPASYVVAGRSMVPTLFPGDRVLIIRDAYIKQQPQRGEIIAIRFKTRPRPMVKRLIAIRLRSEGATCG